VHHIVSGLFELVHHLLDRKYPLLGVGGKMTFLKKLGAFLAKAAAIAVGVGPLIQPFLGSAAPVEQTAVNDLTQVAQIATMVEAVNQAPGSGGAKLAGATPLVLQVLRTSQAFSGKKIADEALAEEGARDIVTGVVKFMNAIHPDEVKTA
jgi:hypothetical protein